MAVAQQAATISLVGLVIFYIFNVLMRRWRRKGAKTAPGPKGLPVVGNALDLAKANGNLNPIFNRWAKEYGPVMQFEVLGQRQVVLSTEKACNDLMVKRGNSYSGRGPPPALVYITRDISPTIMQKTEGWRRGRKLIHGAMSIATNEKYQPFMAHESIKTLRDLLERPADFDKHYKRYAFGVLTRSMFGFDTDSVEHPFVKETDRDTHEALSAFRPDKFPCNIFPFLLKFPDWLVPSNAFLRALRERYYESTVRLRNNLKAEIRTGTARDSIHRYFLENRDEFNLSDDEAGYTFKSIIAAGTRSPHNALLTFTVLLMQYPEWQEKLQAEVDRVVGSSRLPTFDDLPNLPTVRAIIKETLRYRSIVAEISMPHRLDEDDFYEGYFFPKGTFFHANFSTILMDKDLYPDQKLFNPARWLEPSYPTYREPLTVYPNTLNFTPFGYGRRMCPGGNFAERTLSIMLARISWTFDLRAPVDPSTKKPVAVDIKYEQLPNPKPLPFPCDIVPRGAERVEVLRREIGGL